jgi:flagellar biosynthesis protein FlhF
MQIKRFEAKDMTTALRLIKGELGPEAVILSARNIKKANTILGLTKSVSVEVTAAVDAYHLPVALNSVSYAGALKGYRRNTPINGSKRRTLRQSVGSRVKTLTHRKQTRDFEKRVRFESESACADVFQHLLSQEVNRDIATEIAAALREQYQHQHSRFETKAEIISKISDILKRKIGGAKVPLDAQTDSQVIAVIGPTGVGKTTTVAKLAAKHAIELKKKVALISLDSFRIGAAEQLKVYAKAIGIPIKTAGTLAGFKIALNEFRKFDLILVDTPGFNPEKQTEIDDLKAYLTCNAAIAIHLVLSAGTKESDLRNTFGRIKPLAAQNLIFTKLDESRTYGNLINFLMEYPLPLSFLTHGREVPEAIESGSLERIVACILGSFIHPAEFSSSGKSGSSSFEESTRPEGTYFVANKNSDVFHLPDCKWTQKIRSKNRVTFSNVQAAQEKHYMPCRDCQPLKRGGLNIEYPMGDHVRLSNYL